MVLKRVVGVVVVVLIVAGGLVFWRFSVRPPAPKGMSVAEGAGGGANIHMHTPESDAELLASWGKGTFTRLRDADIPRAVERNLVIDCQADVPPEALVALRAKLAAFLKAYSTTDFGNYVAYRDAETVCAAGDPRLATLTTTAKAAMMATAKPGSSDPPEPVPTEPLKLMEVFWRVAVSVGVGPLQPGPIIESVNWQTARVTVRSLARNQLVLEEWDHAAGLESHLCKEFSASGRPSVNIGVFQPGIPNKVSVADIVARDGHVVFADVELIYRTGEDPGHPLVLRFVWDSSPGRWLPLIALSPWGSSRKPFFW